jgi:hypothetical protein
MSANPAEVGFNRLVSERSAASTAVRSQSAVVSTTGLTVQLTARDCGTDVVTLMVSSGWAGDGLVNRSRW